MQQKVETYIQKHQLLDHKKAIIVGVSGGTDSVALLHILVSLGYDCVIAHCNFHLRMEESDRDEEFVRELGKHINVSFYRIDFKTTEYASSEGISIEMAARDLRYNWFHELLKELDAQAIAVAHHADDSIETMLMNLVRGTGLRGLTGIQPRNKKVVRPLLCCTRLELENYLIEEGLDHVEDSSNASTDYQRNKFRNEIIPLLEEVNPSARQTLYDSLLRFEGNLAIYQQAIDRIKEQIIYKTGGVIRFNIELIKQQVHIPTIMYELLQPYGFSPALIEQVTQNLDAESGKIFYSDNYRLLKDRKYLLLSAREETTTDSYLIQEDDTELTEPIKLTLQKMTVVPGFKVSKERECVHLDAAQLHFPLQLRHWREGDSFFPFGMKQRQKVSDFFINNKLSMLEKEHSWLLVSGEDIVWIVGQRMDNRFRLTDETKEVVEVNCKL